MGKTKRHYSPSVESPPQKGLMDTAWGMDSMDFSFMKSVQLLKRTGKEIEDMISRDIKEEDMLSRQKPRLLLGGPVGTGKSSLYNSTYIGLLRREVDGARMKGFTSTSTGMFVRKAAKDDRKEKPSSFFDLPEGRYCFDTIRGGTHEGSKSSDGNDWEKCLRLLTCLDDEEKSSQSSTGMFVRKAAKDDRKEKPSSFFDIPEGRCCFDTIRGGTHEGSKSSDGNDWKKYLRAPTDELLFTYSRQDASHIGPREKTSQSSGEKEWPYHPKAATILLRVSAVTFNYSRQAGDQKAPGEKKNKSSGEKEWMNYPRAANILLRVSAETFVFSRGDVDKKGPKEKKSKSSNGTEGWGLLKRNPKALQEFDEYDKIIRCCVCLHEDACVLFFPCRHMTTCEGCADIVTDCPLCRLRIKGTVKINVV